MKKYFLLVCLLTNALCAESAPAHYKIEDPWYLNYKKAAGTGAIIGLLMIPFNQISSVVLSKLQNTFPDIPYKMTYPLSGALAACFLVATLKALDPYRSRERDRKKTKELL